MSNLRTLACLTVLGLALVGCSKSEPEVSTTDTTTAPPPMAADTQPAAAATPNPATPELELGPETVPGENAIRRALASGQYQDAVNLLVAMKPTPDKLEAYRALHTEVKFTIMDASQADPKAAQALMMLRAATAGR